MWSKKVRWDFYDTSAVHPLDSRGLHMKIFVGIGSVVFASITDKVFRRSDYSFISILAQNWPFGPFLARCCVRNS